MPSHGPIPRSALAFAEARALERATEAAEALAPAWDPVVCVAGRVYAKRPVRRRDAGYSDTALDRATRWC